MRGHYTTEGARLVLLLTVATIPVVLAGLALKLARFDIAFRSIKVIGWAMLIFGIVLYFVDQKSTLEKRAPEWNYTDAIKLGLWQMITLIPSTSRSGITITGALQMGYTREGAAKISMLMPIPTVLASGILLGRK
jgi:undecaprenyl-diphosphatase